MAITLCVDEINDDGTFALTNDLEAMGYNIQQLKAINGHNFTSEEDSVFQAGRYIGVVMLDSNELPGMMFFDIKQNRHRAFEISQDLFPDNIAELFMKQFDKISKTYELNYNEVELIISNSFSSRSR